MDLFSLWLCMNITFNATCCWTRPLCVIFSDEPVLLWTFNSTCCWTHPLYGLYNLIFLLDEPIYLLILLCIHPPVDLIILTLMGWTCSLMYLWAQLYQLTFMGWTRSLVDLTMYPSSCGLDHVSVQLWDYTHPHGMDPSTNVLVNFKASL